MRSILVLLLLIPLCASQAVDLPVFVSGGVGTRWPSLGENQNIAYNVNIALLSPEIAAQKPRFELDIGAWYLWEEYDVVGCWSSGGHRSVENLAFYQAVKLSLPYTTIEKRATYFNIGLGFGLHEERVNGGEFENVPRAHFSLRLNFYPSHVQTPIFEIEYMPGLSHSRDNELLCARLGHSFSLL